MYGIWSVVKQGVVESSEVDHEWGLHPTERLVKYSKFPNPNLGLILPARAFYVPYLQEFG